MNLWKGFQFGGDDQSRNFRCMYRHGAAGWKNGRIGLEKRQNDDVCSISSVFSVSREIAILLLIHFNWDMNAAEEEWFRDGERIHESIGLLMDPHPVVGKLFNFNDDIVFCRICLEDFGVDQMTGASCGHVFCYTCCISYIRVSINDGPGCLSLRCPDPSCCVATGEDMMKKLMSKEDEIKCMRYLITSYVENSKKLKWCPSQIVIMQLNIHIVGALVYSVVVHIVFVGIVYRIVLWIVRQ